MDWINNFWLYLIISLSLSLSLSHSHSLTHIHTHFMSALSLICCAHVVVVLWVVPIASVLNISSLCNNQNKSFKKFVEIWSFEWITKVGNILNSLVASHRVLLVFDLFFLELTINSNWNRFLTSNVCASQLITLVTTSVVDYALRIVIKQEILFWVS